jgi:ABC-type transport system involved in cytochrome bd biosynthesis fused ATPase/permease subunit
LWANPDVDEAALWRVLRMVGAEEIARNAAQGLDTVVGQRGSLLSGGKRQRYALPARCYADRISSCSMKQLTLSMSRENAVFERLLRATPRPTIGMIVHRLESLRHCQRVLLFEGGTIVSEGSGTRTTSVRNSGNWYQINQDLSYRQYR